MFLPEAMMVFIIVNIVKIKSKTAAALGDTSERDTRTRQIKTALISVLIVNDVIKN